VHGMRWLSCMLCHVVLCCKMKCSCDCKQKYWLLLGISVLGGYGVVNKTTNTDIRRSSQYIRLQSKKAKR
jgi:hypothetical protein